MRISKVQAPATYNLEDLTESQMKVILMSLAMFCRPMGVKSGYQDLAAELQTRILATNLELW